MRSSRPQRRIRSRLHPCQLPCRQAPQALTLMAAPRLFRCVTLVLCLSSSRCRSVAHLRRRRACRHRRTALRKAIVRKAHSRPKVTCRSLASPARLCPQRRTWRPPPVHHRHSRLSTLLEGSSPGSASFHMLCCVIYSTIFLVVEHCLLPHLDLSLISFHGSSSSKDSVVRIS
jgi:hypothetical protein